MPLKAGPLSIPGSAAEPRAGERHRNVRIDGQPLSRNLNCSRRRTRPHEHKNRHLDNSAHALRLPIVPGRVGGRGHPAAWPGSTPHPPSDSGKFLGPQFIGVGLRGVRTERQQDRGEGTGDCRKLNPIKRSEVKKKCAYRFNIKTIKPNENRKNISMTVTVSSSYLGYT